MAEQESTARAPSALAERLLAGRDGEAGSRERVAELLRAHLDDARARWSGVSLTDDDFVEHLAARLVPEHPVAEALEGLRGPELFLACACAQGSTPAIEHLERLVRGELAAAFARLKSRGTDAADLQQRLFQRLLTRDGERPPRILDYTGRGSLRAWVKVAAVRLRIDAERRRSDKAATLDEKSERLLKLADGVDPELGFLKQHYRGHFKQAFQESLGQLTPEQRNLLRLTVIDGVSATEIARLHNVHRATAKRWLVSARAQLLEATRARLMANLKVDKGEFESIIRLIQSNLEVSMRRFLDD
ncbi:MAG: sigma-70 family RNA polymerase sigma factor [Myxococcales bacterium]|nr:sigma-70 family RNA polymerase sigma factor [Myxococcales bacterium]